jgi:hypothetical protein
LPGGNAILGIDEIPRISVEVMEIPWLPWSYHGMEALKIAMRLEEIMKLDWV